MPAKRQTVLIIDFGSPTAQNAARRIREQRVFARIVPYTAPVEEIESAKPLALVLVGGHSAYNNGKLITCDSRYFGMGVPVLALGQGMRTMIEALGGKGRDVEPFVPETVEVRASGKPSLFADMPVEFAAGIAGDLVEKLPNGFRASGKSDLCPHAAIADEKRRFYGLAFHPEMDDMSLGRDIFRNFLYNVCGADGDWEMSTYIDYCVKDIRNTVKENKVVLALSGGVDSTVVAVLLNRALGDRLHCVFVNHGLLRKDEYTTVLAQYKDRFKLNVKGVDASARFLGELKGVTDPEQKRKIIGRVFIEVFEEEAAHIDDAKFLAQGTIYPDVIESYSPHDGKKTAVKSHHNVGGLPEKLGLKLVEPLRELFKDEVRELGLELGVPPENIWRHPFPGPGLAVRIIGDITPERVALLQEVDAIVMRMIHEAGLYRKVWQAFPVLLPISSTAVKDDERHYGNVVALRIVESRDAMAAVWARLPYDLLDRMSQEIIASVEGIGRVVYDISSKPPATIEWE